MKLIEIKPGINKISLKSSTHKEDVFLYGFNGGDLNFDLILDLEHENINVYGVFVASKNQVYNISTLSDHTAASSSSRLHIKSISLDDSVFKFTGMIKIENTAQVSDAYLKNDNLVLSENAKVDSSPQLEILADDVKASHGVTISRLDDDEIFYIKSRGLSDADCRKLIIYGFLNDLLSKLNETDYKLVNSKVVKILNY